MKSSDTSDFSEVRDAYCNTAMTVRDICARFAITRAALYRRAKEENWPKRRKTRAGKPAAKHPGADMITRLSGVFLTQLQEAEAAMKSPPASAAEREREGRGLSVLLRNYEKLKEYEEMRLKTDAKISDEQNGWQSAEEEQIRKALYKRLARVVQKRRSGNISKRPETERSELPET